ncbi:MAG: hypothetical protein LBU95_02560, partial [Rikenellaceae bacterium]|nr:hypothetical protein [Rikenellaceae bacterium]
MKQVFVLLCVVLCILSGCGRRAQQAAAEVDSLKLVMAHQDTMITGVFRQLDRIMTNLQAIKERENIIAATVAEGELHDYTLGRISADIAAIDTLLHENRRVIESLRANSDELRRAHINVGTFDRLLDQLSAQLNTNDSQIVELRRQLEERNIQVKTLTGTVAGLTQKGEMLEDQVRVSGELLNIAYYIVDSQKELLKHDVITKTGFIGRTLKVNENRSLDSFTKIDI